METWQAETRRNPAAGKAHWRLRIRLNPVEYAPPSAENALNYCLYICITQYLGIHSVPLTCIKNAFFSSACWRTAALLSQTNMNCWIQRLLFTFACSWSHQLWVSSFLAVWPCLSATVIDRWQSPSAVNLTRIAPTVHKISIETVFHAGFAAYYWWPEVHLKVLSVSSEWGPHIPLLYKLMNSQ